MLTTTLAVSEIQNTEARSTTELDSCKWHSRRGSIKVQDYTPATFCILPFTHTCNRHQSISGREYARGVSTRALLNYTNAFHDSVPTSVFVRSLHIRTIHCISCNKLNSMCLFITSLNISGNHRRCQVFRGRSKSS